MFLDYYELPEQPFGVTPDPKYLYLSRTHREALASLHYGLESGRGFLALIAKPGMGKTTLLFQLLERLKCSARTVFLFQTQCNSRELLQYLMSDLGFDCRGQDFATMHQQLNEVLARERLSGKDFVLVIDEAQNLDDTTLETVRLLSDFETPQKKMLQIVLSGQPQLAKKLARPGLIQLRQRISIHSWLEPFDTAETAHYVENHLQVAGYQGRPIFTRAALELIAVHSEGIPRTINNLCFNALSLGYAMNRKTIDTDSIREVAADQTLGLVTLTARPPLTRSPASPAASAPRVAQSAVGVPSAPAPRHTTPALSYGHKPQRKGVLGGWGFRVAVVAGTVILGLTSWLTINGSVVWRNLAQPAVTAIHAASAPTPEESAVTQSEAPAQAAATSAQSTAPETNVQDETQVQVTPNAQEEQKPEVPQFILVRVKQGETLRQICTKFLNRYDRELLNAVLAANPEIVDPDQIEVGQRIRIPVGSAAGRGLNPRTTTGTN